MRYISHPFESRYWAWKNLFIISILHLKVDYSGIWFVHVNIFYVEGWINISSLLGKNSQNVGIESAHCPQRISFFQEAVCLFFNGQQRIFEQQCHPNHTLCPGNCWWQQCMCQSVMVMCLNKCRLHLCQIVVLEEGRVVERASHEVLLGLNGRYAQLWHQQNSTDGGSDTDRTDGASDITLGSSTSWCVPGFLVVLNSWDDQEGTGPSLQKQIWRSEKWEKSHIKKLLYLTTVADWQGMTFLEKYLIMREITFVPNAGIYIPVITWGENKSVYL